MGFPSAEISDSESMLVKEAGMDGSLIFRWICGSGFWLRLTVG
jgi:hypothetical protein